MIKKEEITGLVLSGGKSSRMGRDKGLILFKNIPLFMHSVTRLSPQVGTIFVNANQNLSDYQKEGLPVITDNPMRFDGPLSGFLTGLRHCKTPYLLVVPCDSPFFPMDLASRLATQLLADESDLAFVITKEKWQPVFALIKKETMPKLISFLESKERKIETWYRKMKTSRVNFDDESAFYNINTLYDLEQIK